MYKRIRLPAALACVLFLAGCLPRPSPAGPVAGQTAMAVAVDATLTSVAVNATPLPSVFPGTPSPEPTSAPTFTPAPTPDCARHDVLEFCAEMTELLADDRAVEDAINQYFRSPEARAASVEQFLAKYSDSQGQVVALREGLFALDVPPEGRSIRDLLLEGLDGRVRTYDLVSLRLTTGDPSYSDACNTLNDAVDKTMLEVSDIVEDLQAWAEQANCSGSGLDESA